MGRLHALTDGVLVATSAKYALNTVVVSRGSGSLLVDPGWTPGELGGLAGELCGPLAPAAGFSTHAHYDHLLWHPGFGAVPRWSSPSTARLAEHEREGLLEGLGDGYEGALTEVFGRVTALDEEIVPWDGPTARLIVHDAHERGHTALWLPWQETLIAGDMLSDVELPLLGSGDLESYRRGLDLLAPWVTRARWVVPGHGTPGTDGVARLDADRRYLDALAAGRIPDDPRLANPGMATEHASNVRIVHPAP